MTPEDHADALFQRMPPADDLWDSPNSAAMLRALAGAASRVDHAANQHLRDYNPLTCGESGAYIADWARVLGLPRAGESEEWAAADNAGKAEIIQAALRLAGDPTLASFQTLAAGLFGPTAVLTQAEHPSYLCGSTAASGSPIGSAWQAVWTLRYMPNVLGAAPDDFSGWGFAAHASAVAQSPRTLTATADRLTGVLHPPNGLYAISKALVGVTDNQELRLSVWYRSDDTAKAFKFALLDRDGTLQEGPALKAKPNLWQKSEFLINAGVGPSAPEMWLFWAGGDMLLSYAVAGVRNPGRESRMSISVPSHTRGEFLVVDE